MSVAIQHFRQLTKRSSMRQPCKAYISTFSFAIFLFASGLRSSFDARAALAPRSRTRSHSFLAHRVVTLILSLAAMSASLSFTVSAIPPTICAFASLSAASMLL